MSSKDNTVRGAKNAGLLVNRSRQFRDFVGTQDRVDTYKLLLTSRSSFSLSIRNTAADVDVELTNSLGRVIQSSRRQAKPSQRINLTLDADTYYVQVRTRGEDTPYTLQLRGRQATGIPDPGREPDKARDLGTLTAFTLTDYVGPLDRADYYRFDLAQISEFKGSVVGPTAPATMSLYFDRNNNGLVDQGELVTSSSGFRQANDPIDTTLPAGSYFLKVEGRGGRYDLRLSTRPDPGNVFPDPGNTSDRALDTIGNLSGAFVAKDYIGVLDTVDFYRFNLAEISSFDATVSGSSVRTVMTLYFDRDGDRQVDVGEQVTTGSGSRFSSDPIKTVLPKGNYFIKVEGGSTRYDLTLSATPTPGNLPTDPGSNPLDAYALGNLSGSTVLKDYVGVLDSEDLFRFNLTQISDVTATITGLSARADKVLFYDRNNDGLISSSEQVDSGTGLATSGEPIVTTLPVGTYFLRVTGETTRYDLNLSATPYANSNVEDPGDAPANAKDLGDLQPLVVEDYVGVLDSLDYYKFQLSQNRNVRISILGRTTQTNVSLLADFRGSSLQLQDTGFGSSASSDDITASLQSGITYYLKVDGQQSTGYKLQVEFI